MFLTLLLPGTLLYPQGTSHLPQCSQCPLSHDPSLPKGALYSGLSSSLLPPVLDFGSQRATEKATKPSTHWWLGVEDWAGANLQSYPEPHTAQPQPPLGQDEESEATSASSELLSKVLTPWVLARCSIR